MSDAVLLRADALLSAGDITGAREAVASLVDDAGATPTGVRVRALLLRARAHHRAGEGEAARADVDGAVAAAAEGRDPASHAMALASRAELHLHAGDPASTVADLDHALTLLPEPGSPGDAGRTRAAMLHVRAVARARLADRSGALADADAVVATLEHVGDDTERAHAHQTRAELRLQTGDLAGTGHDLDAAQSLHADLHPACDGARHRLGGRLRLLLGDLAGATTDLAHARRRATEAGDRSGQAAVARTLAEVALAQGDLVAARREIDAALALDDAIGDEAGAADDRRIRAQVRLRTGDGTGAAADVGAALDRVGGDRTRQAAARRTRAEVHLRSGHLVEAAADIEEALAHHREVGDGIEEAHDLRVRASLRSIRGDETGAVEDRRRADAAEAESRAPFTGN